LICTWPAWDTKDNLPFGLADALDQRLLEVMRVLGHHAAEALQHVMDGLVEFRLAGVTTDDRGKDGLEFFVDAVHCWTPVTVGLDHRCGVRGNPTTCAERLVAVSTWRLFRKANSSFEQRPVWT
jgi:hypothetical protein